MSNKVPEVGGATRPPPPKPTKENSFFVDSHLTNSVLPSKLSSDQLKKFIALSKNEQPMPAEVVLLNLGVAIAVLEDYTRKDKKDKHKKSPEQEAVAKREAVENALENYYWVFFTDNHLGDGLRQLMEVVEREGIINKVENTDTYIVAIEA